MTSMWWQIPALILTILSIFGMFWKMSRWYARMEETMRGHSKLIKKCEDTTYITSDGCKKEQADCRNFQSEENAKILAAIKEMNEEFKRNVLRLHDQLEAKRQIDHDELMKINKALGRIEGVVGKYRFDDE